MCLRFCFSFRAVSCIFLIDLFFAQPFLRRERYKLFVSFYEALMVAEKDAPVEFEVSIGKFGTLTKG